MLQKLKERWGISSNFQLTVIFIVFGITGSMSVKLGQPLLDYLDFTPEKMGGLLYYTLRIVLIFPLYQILLLFFGTVFFQFRFFWEFEKKMLRKLKLYPKEKTRSE